MMAVSRQKALHEIVSPTGEVRDLGGAYDNGTPRQLAIQRAVRPGDFFVPASEAELTRLLDAKACRPVRGSEDQTLLALEPVAPWTTTAQMGTPTLSRIGGA